MLLLQFYWGDETQTQKAATKKAFRTDDHLDTGMRKCKMSQRWQDAQENDETVGASAEMLAVY